LLDISKLPKEILGLSQYVGWKYEFDHKTQKEKKPPFNPHTGYKASITDPKTWGTLEQALAAVEKYKLNGIGFVFTEENGIIANDLDDCLIDDYYPAGGETTPKSASILTRYFPFLELGLSV